MADEQTAALRKELAERLRAKMELEGLTIRQAAREAGVTVNMAFRAIHPERAETVDLVAVMRLAHWAGASLGELQGTAGRRLSWQAVEGDMRALGLPGASVAICRAVWRAHGSLRG